MTTFSKSGILPLLLAAAGCYTFTPVAVTPVPGQRLVLDLNDHGRADLRGLIGPEVVRLEGTLAQQSDTSYVVSVWETRGIFGAPHRWSGETVSVRREYINVLAERRFSRPRTGVAVLAGAAGVLAFILTRNLLGFGGGDIDNVPPPPPGGNDQ